MDFEQNHPLELEQSNTFRLPKKEVYCMLKVWKMNRWIILQ